MYTYKLVMGNHTGSARLDKEFNRHLFLVKFQQTWRQDVVDTDRYTVVSRGSLQGLNGRVKYFEETKEDFIF